MAVFGCMRVSGFALFSTQLLCWYRYGMKVGLRMPCLFGGGSEHMLPFKIQNYLAELAISAPGLFDYFFSTKIALFEKKPVFRKKVKIARPAVPLGAILFIVRKGTVPTVSKRPSIATETKIYYYTHSELVWPEKRKMAKNTGNWKTPIFPRFWANFWTPDPDRPTKN